MSCYDKEDAKTDRNPIRTRRLHVPVCQWTNLLRCTGHATLVGRTNGQRGTATRDRSAASGKRDGDDSERDRRTGTDVTTKTTAALRLAAASRPRAPELCDATKRWRPRVRVRGWLTETLRRGMTRSWLQNVYQGHSQGWGITGLQLSTLKFFE